MSRPRSLTGTLLLLSASTLVISGGGWLCLQQWQAARARAVVRTLVQTGQEREPLPTAYLAELLNLSIDRPRPLHTLNVKAYEERLLSSPLIARARIERLPPHGVMIDYTARRPIFSLGDVENGAVDLEGVLFPLSPFYTPKALPKLFVGTSEWAWGKAVEERQVTLLRELHFLLQAPAFFSLKLLTIDIRRAFHPKLGERELIFGFEEGSTHAYLRCTPQGMHDALARYLLLRTRLGGEKRVVIDLRSPETALVRRAKNE